MCGITAVVSHQSSPVFAALQSEVARLMHRGSDGFGLAFDVGNTVAAHTFLGRLRPFRRSFPGNVGIGHVRYRTRGDAKDVTETQPLVSADGRMALAHNGQVEAAGAGLDSQVLLDAFRACRTEDDVFRAVRALPGNVRGAWSCVLMVVGMGVFAFRDPWGIRPLCYRRQAGMTVVTSENMGHLEFRDVRPGACILFRPDGSKTAHAPPIRPTRLCAFELVYFAHETSTLDGISVRAFRQRMGQALAVQLRADPWVARADFVTYAPKTAQTGAEAFAASLGKSLVETLRRTSSRSFIQPTQEAREQAVQRKFELLGAHLVQGRRILITDDSIVRGASMRFLVKLFRDAGAFEIGVASLAPPVRHDNVYGIDIVSQQGLVARGTDAAGVAKALGADRVFFLDLSTFAGLAPGQQLDMSVFDGVYCCGGPEDEAASTAL